MLSAGLKTSDIRTQLEAAERQGKTPDNAAGAKLMAYTLDDGTAIEIDEATGAGYYLNDDGSRGDFLPTGEYTLEDGTVIVVGENGLVTDMLSPEMARDIEKQRKEAAEVQQQVKQLKAQVKQLTEQLADLKGEGTPPVNPPKTELRETGDDDIQSVILRARSKARKNLVRL